MKKNNKKKIIKQTLEYLNFKQDHFILSPLSIPSFPTLYYASQLTPTPLILPKPLVNIRTIPQNIKLKPPNHFPTPLHIFMSQAPTFTKQNINHFNNPFCQKFNQNQVQ
ncbi:accessory Sec system protein Asp2, partial [Staphylococcus capitis]|uniref:accessory Sec system protein Asp2 n=1 Tax=Staphylococcus capitis TaxID=29388 RepID=UPI0028CB559D